MIKLERLSFDSAVFSGIDSGFDAGVINSKIHVVARLSEQAAQHLGIKWAFTTKSLEPRNGFKLIGLDAEMEHLRLKMRVEGVYSDLILDSEMADGFRLVVTGGKNPKPFLKFRIAHTGNIYEFLEYMVNTGATPGQLEIERRQAEMFPAEQAQEEPAPAEVAALCEAPAEEAQPEDQAPGQPSRYEDEPFEPEVDAPVVEPSPQPAATENGQLQKLARDLNLSPEELRGLDRISPDASEWRIQEEIQRGIPHHIEPEAVR